MQYNYNYIKNKHKSQKNLVFSKISFAFNTFNNLQLHGKRKKIYKYSYNLNMQFENKVFGIQGYLLLNYY